MDKYYTKQPSCTTPDGKEWFASGGGNKPGVSEWICETCIYYPPSSTDGKPCCMCNPDEPLLNSYCRKEDGEK